MVTVQVDSAWLVIFAVSLVVLPFVVLIRRAVGARGGFTPGALLLIPLVLPLVAAALFQHGVLPEISVLRPAASALLEPSDTVYQLVLLDGGRVVIPYALTGSAGPWLLLIGGSLSSFMLLRRIHGHIGLRRLVRRSRRIDPGAPLATTVTNLATAAGAKRAPDLFICPVAGLGAFTTGGRRPAVVLSEDLLEHLDDEELEAVLAHEIAHIASHDVRVIAIGGVLRDMVVWNPLAHIAYRYLRNSREIEADRRAAVLTGDPLAVASGLVKMCKLVGGRTGRRRIAALSFRRRKERVSTRVSGLLILADGRAQVRDVHPLPYLLAAALVVTLGLQVGAQLGRANGSALAFVWGTPEVTAGDVWSGEPDAWEPKRKRSERARHKTKPGPARARLLARDLDDLMLSPMALRARDVPVWIDTLVKVAKEQGLPAKSILMQTRQNWGTQALIGDSVTGSFGTYWIEREPSQDR
jgi:Zn-dependent protease with chaperone function